ncbi:MAG: acetyl-CoA carboxylase carboxyltransferase subunit alpha [Cyanobacteria bacterium]|nr:acetyl-CoA carboxylase carboxyltransferase subunit alpha [Cyanobacteriota bacterium]MDA1020827.1 acetyl-CoA carboxylase carboxyltransferase subunit alpha [Cyanobacteriota bacterium]
MGLRDFFKSVRAEKFANQAGTNGNNGLSDDEILANWVQCKSCKATIHRSAYQENLNVCVECNHHGMLSAEERIALLTDTNSFIEIDANISPSDPLNFNDGKPYLETLVKAQTKTGHKEAIITGFGQIEGVKVALAVMNFSFLGGSMGTVVGEKFTRLAEKAVEEKTPFIVVSSSGGARMHEGILSLMQMAKTSFALAELAKAKLPYFSILTDPTYGGVSASFATLGDLLIAEPGTRIGFAGRRVIEETVREKLPGDFQTAEYLLAHGQIDFIVDRNAMKMRLATLLRIHGFAPKQLKVSDTITARPFKLNQIDQPKKDIILDFEKPLAKIQEEIKLLEKRISNNADKAQINQLKAQYSKVEANTYASLSPIDITKIARHPNRPGAEDYLNMICGKDKWIELHGDRAGTDDEAVLTALVEHDGLAFVAVGTRKGRGIKENQKRNFGMPQPEGYRKAKRIFEYANKFNLPIVTFIDTPGAYPGVNAEANGQSIAIAENLKALAGLEVPVLSVVTGEGGSGGALAIGVANRVLMLENSVYSVISPEGCAAILWRTRDKAPEAAAALKITAKDLLGLKVVEELIAEPQGGAHKNWAITAEAVQEAVFRNLKELVKMSARELYQDRKTKFYAYGKVDDSIKEKISSKI